MKKASIIRILNDSGKNVILWPKQKKYKDFARLIRHGDFLILDCRAFGFILDLDECYFQLNHSKKKISVENISKYGCHVEYWLM